MTDPKPFVIPPDLPADVMQYERGWNACLAALAPEPATAGTPSSRWSADGKPDPHGNVYDCERAQLAHGDMTDDELANEVFLCNHRDGDFARIGLLTAAKDRIRWLSRRLEEAKATPAAAVPDDLLTAGSMLANCAYNLAQDDRLSDRHRASLDESRRARDAARRKLAAAPNRPADAQRGVPEIEQSPDDSTRHYIPMPGGWEVQTRGRGSSFRICDTKSGDRMNIGATRFEHEFIERMGREVHAAWKALAASPASEVSP